MDRFEFEDLISAYIENDLPLHKRKDLEAYLDKNPSQNQLVKQIANNMEALKKIPKKSTNDNFNQKLMEKIKFNNLNFNPIGIKRGNIFGFTFLNASVLLGLIFLLFIFSFQITGLMPSLKNNDTYQFKNNKMFLGKNEMVKKNEKEDTFNPNLTSLQNDTTKKEKVDFSRNIKFVNE